MLSVRYSAKCGRLPDFTVVAGKTPLSVSYATGLRRVKPLTSSDDFIKRDQPSPACKLTFQGNGRWKKLSNQQLLESLGLDGLKPEDDLDDWLRAHTNEFDPVPYSPVFFPKQNDTIVLKVYKTKKYGGCISAGAQLGLLGQLPKKLLGHYQVLLQGKDQALVSFERIPGQTLKAYLESKANHLSEKEGEQILRKIISAVGELHREGWYHYDLKGDNVMRTPEGNIRLIDFDEAIHIDSKHFNPHEYRRLFFFIGRILFPRKSKVELTKLMQKIAQDQSLTEMADFYAKAADNQDLLDFSWRLL